jgi:hypothetical protein
VSPADLRTVAELLADSDALARETLLDTTIDHAPAMVRSSNQLIESAADLWTILPSERNNTSGSDPMERVRMVGQAIGCSVKAGHWPGHGPTDERLQPRVFLDEQRPVTACTFSQRLGPQRLSLSTGDALADLMVIACGFIGQPS